jgi:hypothetical protein
LCAWCGAPFAPAAKEYAPAGGGAHLLRGAEVAKRTVVARVEDVGRIDEHGYGATFAVLRDLAASEPSPGETLRIGWEELAPDRPARFRKGERVLVALEALPGYSLWRKRFPNGDALAVAERGAAFLRDPDDASIERLARYLHVDPTEREQAPGVEALAGIVEAAAPPLAEGAAKRLRETPGLGSKLRQPAAAALGAAIESEARDASLRRDLIQLAAAHRLDGMRESIARVAESQSPLAGQAWAALVAIDGGMSAETVHRLLTAPDAGVRAVAARAAPGTPDAERALGMARTDPAPEVRIAVVEAFVPTGTPASLETGYAALFDRDPPVRAAAAQAVGQRGADVVPHLRELALARSGRDASGPLGALAFAGAEGQGVLLELSQTHPDENTRGQARLMLGLDPRKR